MKNLVKKAKQAVLDISEEQRRLAQARAAEHYYDRWMEETRANGIPCERPDQIDYSIPGIHLEYLLCDPLNIHRCRSPKRLHELEELLTPEELELLHAVGPDGHGYLKDLRSQTVGEVMQGVKELRREGKDAKKGKKTHRI